MIECFNSCPELQREKPSRRARRTPGVAGGTLVLWGTKYRFTPTPWSSLMMLL
jgi:hypothetical protein